MARCTRYCAAESHFGEKRAERDSQQYHRRGADHVTQLLLAELRRWPLQDKQLLDIGAGIGVIDAELAGNGLAGATVVEASPSYIEAAREQIQKRYGPRPTRFVLGDFALLAGTLPDADVVTLDRVVCCYPDARTLLRAAALKTRQVLAFSYPRDRWYVRVTIAGQNLLRRLKGSTFRVLVHSPRDMSATLEDCGLKRTARCQTLTWVIDLYGRNPASRTNP